MAPKTHFLSRPSGHNEPEREATADPDDQVNCSVTGCADPAVILTGSAEPGKPGGVVNRVVNFAGWLFTLALLAVLVAVLAWGRALWGIGL